MRLAYEHPVIGVGLDGFYGTIGHIQNIEYPHQYLLAVAAEGGAVGIGLLAVSFGLWAVTVRRGRGYRRETAITVAAAAFVAISSLFSGDYYDARLAWLFPAMAAAAAISGRPPTSSPAVDAATSGAAAATGTSDERSAEAGETGDAARVAPVPPVSVQPKQVDTTAPPRVEVVRLHRVADLASTRPLRKGSGR